jgi:hypothetical protein
MHTLQSNVSKTELDIKPAIPPDHGPTTLNHSNKIQPIKLSGSVFKTFRQNGT